MTRAELLAALAAATGPDRALDFWLWWYCKANVADPDKPPPADYVADNLHTAPRYAASLDAAMTLVPEGWRLASIVIGWDGDAYYYDAQIARDDKPQDANGEHALIPLALCIAALSARAP